MQIVISVNIISCVIIAIICNIKHYSSTNKNTQEHPLFDIFSLRKSPMPPKTAIQSGYYFFLIHVFPLVLLACDLTKVLVAVRRKPERAMT